MQSVILGTAQWGLDYGTTNALGRLTDAAVSGLVSAALVGGIRVLDTAPGYGDAEARIGLVARDFAVQTKVSVSGSPPGHVRDSVRASLKRLGRSGLDAVLVHDWATADGQDRAAAATLLEDLRGDGLVRAVGVSGYDEADIVSALALFASLDVVQVPVSVLDQRLDGSTAVAELRSGGGRLQARSVLLQGAAVADAAHPLFGAHPDVVRLRRAGDPLALCLGFIRSLSWVDEVVVGATSGEELERVMSALAEPVTDIDWRPLASPDPWLVDPRRWTTPTRQG